MTSAQQNALTAGLPDPVYDSQAVFRSVLAAFSRPGRISFIAVDIEQPSGLHTASAAIALSLFDLSTPYCIDPAIGTDAAIDFIGFHSGARPTDEPKMATFAITGGVGNAVSWDSFAIGTPDYPDRSTTIIVQVDNLKEGGPVALTGPGIQTEHRIQVDGVDAGFWSARQQNAQLYPLGTDIVLVSGARILCLPRTTRVEI